MTNTETLRLALEALKNNRRTHHYCEDTWYSCPKHEDGCANDSEGDECNCGADEANAEIEQAITAIKAALEAKDEPVAWMYSPTGALFDICPNDADEGEFLPLYTTSPQRTWVKLTEEEIKPCWYEACQTDLELTSQLVVYFARAIEAKLKEKNT